MDLFLTALHFAVFILMFVLTTPFFRFSLSSVLTSVLSHSMFTHIFCTLFLIFSFAHNLTHHNNLSSFPSPLSPALLCLSINVLFVVPLLFTLLSISERFSSHFGVVESG